MEEKTEQRRRFLINLVYFVTIVALLYFAIRFTLKWLMPFVIGFVIAIVVDPLIRLLNRKLKIKRKFLSIVLVVLVWVVASFFIYKLGELLVEQAKNFLNYIVGMDLNKTFSGIAEWIDDKFPSLDLSETLSGTDIIGNLASAVVSYAQTLLTGLTSMIMQLPNILIFIVVSVMSSIFISIDFPMIKYFISVQAPKNRRADIMEAKNFIRNKIFRFIRAYSIILIITFAELFICFSVIGLRYALVLALLVALVDLLPVIGTSTILIPWGIVELILGNVKTGIGILVTMAIVFVIRQIIEPRIVSGQVGLHPLITLVCIFVGLKIFGVIGMLIVPLVALCVKELNDTGRIHLWRTPDKVVPEPMKGDFEKK